MDLLVSSASRIIHCNTKTGKKEVVRMNDGEYYGITGDQHKLFTVHTGIDSLDPYYREDYSRSVKGYTTRFGSKPIKSKPELSFPHQIMAYENNLYVANTGKNCLSIYDYDLNLIRDVYPSGKKWDITTDGIKHDHFNSIYIAGSDLYFLAHNHGKKSSVWKLDKESLNTRAILETNAYYAHNIWHEENDLMICNSREGSVYNVDLGKEVWKSPEARVLTRGVALSDDYVFIGRSEYGTRKSRKVSNGGVYVLDRKTYKMLDLIKLKGSGVVYELRILGQRDFAHNDSVMPISHATKLKNVSKQDALMNAIRIPNRFYTFRRNLKLLKSKFKPKN